MRRHTRQPTGTLKQKKPVYIKTARLPKTQGLSAGIRLPEFPLPEETAKEESPRRRAVAKRAAGAWHLGR